MKRLRLFQKPSSYKISSDESTGSIPSVTSRITALKGQLQQRQWSAAKSLAKNALPYLGLADNLRK
jgi:hypothetical protein